MSFATPVAAGAEMAAEAAAFRTAGTWRTAEDAAMHRPPIIANRGEFVDALRALRQGHVLVHASESWGGCSIDGGTVGTAFRTLAEFALIDEFDNPEGFEHIRYYKLNRRGHEFAARALKDWARRPLLERLGARLLG